jgi:hypothetical protein
MQTLAVARLVLLFVHVLAFALALGCVLREDAKLLSSQPLDGQALRAAARLVRFALIILWASGIALIVPDTNAVFARLAQHPKLLAKLTVVGILSLNGVALHLIAFPALLGDRVRRRSAAPIAAALGAVSAASWLAATLLGITRASSLGFTYTELMRAYAVMLAAALAFGLVVVRPRIAKKLATAARCDHRSDRSAALPGLQ